MGPPLAVPPAAATTARVRVRNEDTTAQCSHWEPGVRINVYWDGPTASILILIFFSIYGDVIVPKVYRGKERLTWKKSFKRINRQTSLASTKSACM